MSSIIKKLIGKFLSNTSGAKTEQEIGIIGRDYEDGAPVIYKFVNEMPAEEIRKQLTWLTVISWKYDGSSNNRLPSEAENQRMIILEDVIENNIEKEGFLRHVYSRTGNNLKELVYYINDQDRFLEAFNDVLSDHQRYPIEINFFQDEKWEDFQRLLGNFSKATE